MINVQNHFQKLMIFIVKIMIWIVCREFIIIQVSKSNLINNNSVKAKIDELRLKRTARFYELARDKTQILP